MCYGANAKTLEKLKQREWETLLTYLKQTKNITEFWMPINRVDNNDYHPFVWQLPGRRWGTPFSKNRHNLINETSFGENCVKVVAEHGRITFQVTHCDNLLYNLCIFKDKFVVKSTCKNNFAAIRYKPNVCYGLDEDVKSTAINLTEYIDSAATVRRIVHFIDSKGEFRLMETEAENKGYQLMENERGLLELSNRTVKFKLAKEILEPTNKDVEFILKFDKDKKRLLLTAYFRKYLYRVNRESDEEEDDDDNFGIQCFTNADYNIVTPVKIEKVWEEDEDKPKSVFQLKLYGDGPGEYWCEGHTVFNFKLIKSQRIVATRKQKGHSFAFTYKFPCFDCQIDNLYKTGKSIEKHLVASSKKSQDTRNLVIHNVRVMKIEMVSDFYMTVLCHVTASLKTSSVDNSSEESSEENDEEENEDGIRHDTNVRMDIRGFLETVIIRTGNISKVNSTEFCFPEYFIGSGKNLWATAKLGTTSTAKNFCLQKDGLVVTRRCRGTFLYGAMWEKPTEDIQCVNVQDSQQTLVTKRLYEIEKEDKAKRNPIKTINDVREIIKSNKPNLIPADLFYLGNILKTVSNELAKNPTASISLANDIISIFNHLMDINTSITKSSVKLNSTNILLDAFEKLIDEIFTSPAYTDETITPTSIESSVSEEFQSVEYNDKGVILKLKSKLAIFIIDPSVANISGIVLYGEDDSDRRDGEIDDTYFRFIYTNQTTNELLSENDDDIQIATYFPSSLLLRLDEIFVNISAASTPVVPVTPRPTRPPLRIIIKIYSNDNLFQENNDGEREEDSEEGMVSNKIISISVPGHSNDLPEMLPLIIKKGSYKAKTNSNESTFLDGCYYWNYNNWQDDGVFSQSSDKLSLCNCTHLTPFAYLIGGVINTAEVSDYVLKTKVEQHQSALDIITFVGCALSMVGITGIMVTAFVIKSWRRTLSAKVLLHLSGAIAFQMILFLFVNTEYITKHVLEEKIFSSCVIIGALLHYSVLVQFCWMLVIAYLQYKRYVQVLGKTRPKRFLLKAALVGWGVPLIPVALVVLIDRQSYIPLENTDDSLKVCYPSGNSLYFGIMAPVGGIILANLVIFVIVVYNIVKGPDEALQTDNKKLIMPHIRLSVLLFFLLGCTWSFGLLTAFKAGIIFSYLFCLTATLQGFILFIYFIILDPTTRKLWTKRLRGITNFSSNSRTSKNFEDSTNGYSKY
ncbi:hypothetical protein ACFFRR_006057 [Megaselia abdita]